MRLFYLVFFALIFEACGDMHSFLNEKELNDFIRDEKNGLAISQEADGFDLNMVYRPSDLIANQQLSEPSKKKYDSLCNYFSKFLYFTFEMSRDGKDLETYFATDLGSFADKISFLSYGLGQNIRLITPKDTASVLECLYSRSYGMGRSKCLLVFEKPKVKKFEIEVIGYPIGFGRHTFIFSLSDIENTPRLKTNYL